MRTNVVRNVIMSHSQAASRLRHLPCSCVGQNMRLLGIASHQPERQHSNDGGSVHSRYAPLPSYRQRLLRGLGQLPSMATCAVCTAELRLAWCNASCMHSCGTHQYSAARDAKAEQSHSFCAVHLGIKLSMSCQALQVTLCATWWSTPGCTAYRARCCKPCAAPGLHTCATEDLEQAVALATIAALPVMPVAAHRC